MVLGEWTKPWDTIYFGGGTPSLLPAEQIASFIQHIRKTRGIVKNAEITLEANPEDIQEITMEKWLMGGINRVSLGVQSLSNTELLAMNRAHGADTSIRAVEKLLKAGFQSVNLDFIYGSQWLDDNDWKNTLEWAFSSGAQHISAYALTAEPNTRLWKDIRLGKIPNIDEDKQARHFEWLQAYAETFGWEHYEISNLCKPGYKAIHNSHYWENKPYLGLGPSAHSFDGKRTRRWNISDNKAYVSGIENQKPDFEEEKLTDINLVNEILITRLRLSDGLDFQIIEAIIPEWVKQKEDLLLEMSEKKLIFMKNNCIKLTQKGRLFSDAISRDLML